MKDKVRAEGLSYIKFMEKKKNPLYLVHLLKWDKQVGLSRATLDSQVKVFQNKSWVQNILGPKKNVA